MFCHSMEHFSILKKSRLNGEFTSLFDWNFKRKFLISGLKEKVSHILSQPSKFHNILRIISLTKPGKMNTFLRTKNFSTKSSKTIQQFSQPKTDLTTFKLTCSITMITCEM